MEVLNIVPQKVLDKLTKQGIQIYSIIGSDILQLILTDGDSYIYKVTGELFKIKELEEVK